MGWLRFIAAGMLGVGACAPAPRSEQAPAHAPVDTPPEAAGPGMADRAPPPSAPRPVPLAEARGGPVPSGANPSWWLDAPVHADGRIVLAARADADTLIDARRAAVEAGTLALRDAAHAEPAEVQTDKTDVSRLPDGRWRAFVLMSCRDRTGRE